MRHIERYRVAKLLLIRCVRTIVLLYYKCRILLLAELNIDVALLLLYERQADNFLAVFDADQNRLRRVHCDRSDRSTYFQVTYLRQTLRMEGQKVPS